MGLDAAQFRKGFQSFQKDLKRGVGKFQRSMRGLTSIGSVGGGLAAGLGLKSLIRTAGEFEGSMNGVRAVMGSLTAGEFAQLQNKAKELGKTTKFSAIQSAGAIEVLAKNGLKVGDIMGGALDASLLLAASTGAEIPEAADLATDAMLIFGKTAADLGNVVDAVNGVMINSKFGFEDYKNALSTGAPAAVKAGKSLEEFNATIGATASFFASGESAGTAFKVFTDTLVKDTKKAEEAQEKLGISFFDATGKMKSMADIAEGLKTGLAGLSDEDAIKSLTAQFGTRGANFAVALARAGKAGIESQVGLQKMADSAKQAEIRMSGMAGEALKAKSAMEGLLLQIAEGGLLTAVTKLLVKGTELAGLLGKLPAPILNVGVGIVALVAIAGPLAFTLTSIAGVIPVVVGAVGALGSGFLALLGPVGLLVAGLIGAGVLIYQNWDAVVTFFKGAVADIVAAFAHWKESNASTLAAIAAGWETIKEAGLRIFAALAIKIQEFTLWLDKSLEPIGGLQGAWEAFGEFVGLTWSALVVVVKGAVEVLGGVFENLANYLEGNQTGWETFVGIVTEVLQGLAKIVNGIFDEIVAYLKTLPAKMGELGKNLMLGLAKGIKDAALAPVDAIKEVGQSAIDGAKRVFGIESPSKIFKAIGGFLMQGLGLGIEAEASVATKAMEGAAGDVVRAGRAAQTGAGGAAGLVEVTGAQASETKSVFAGVFGDFNSRLGDAVLKGKEGFAALGDSLIAEVGKRALDSVIGNFSSGLGGLFGGTSASGLGGFFKSIFGGLPSFAGGGHTGTGARTGGLDGQGGYLAMVHPRESIIDESRLGAAAGGRGRRGGGVTVTNHFNISPGVTQKELQITMEEAERQRQREERRRYLDGDPSTAQLAY